MRRVSENVAVSGDFQLASCCCLKTAPILLLRGRGVVAAATTQPHNHTATQPHSNTATQQRNKFAAATTRRHNNKTEGAPTTQHNNHTTKQPHRQPHSDTTTTQPNKGENKYLYHRRKVVWEIVAAHFLAGWLAGEACDRIYQIYGANKSVTAIINEMRKDRSRGGHPGLHLANE